MRLGQKLTKEQALQKIKQYCAYQERCHKEVKDKLYGYGLFKNEVDQIIVQLIEDNFLNEERFAIGFAGGKFRIKHWGRNKIVYELKQKQVNSYCIKVALKEIDEEDYIATLEKLALKKWESFDKESKLSKQAKVYSYLLQKGFEATYISKALSGIQVAK